MTELPEIHIDAARALELLAAVVAEHGPDTVYLVPEDRKKCLYAHGTVCGCLVGHALHRAGLTMDELALMDIEDTAEGLGTGIRDAWIPARVQLTGAAREVFEVAQGAQDKGKRWGEALDSARRYAAEYPEAGER